MIELIPIYNNHNYLKQIADWRNDDIVRSGLRSCYPTSLGQQENWIDGVVSDKTCQYYFIFDNALENSFIGYCGLDKMHFANRTAEISLLIDPDKHGKGYGKQVVNELLNIGFNQFNLRLIYAETYFSRSFWESIGFDFEAELKQRKFHNQKYISSYILSKMSIDYIYEKRGKK